MDFAGLETRIPGSLPQVVIVGGGFAGLNTAKGEIAYDFLVLAAGSTHSYFSHDEWGRFAPGLKTIEDALAGVSMRLDLSPGCCGHWSISGR